MQTVIGVDIGGTFTDCVAVAGDGRVTQAKTLSTQSSDAAAGVLTGLDALAARSGLDRAALLADTRRFAHGTTIGTNLVAERTGAAVGLITTAGHRDVILMMRGAGRTAGLPIDRVFSVHATDVPTPLVPPSRIVEVHERVDVTGEIVAPLDEAGARRSIEGLLASGGIDAVAISLLWSFKRPEHERRLAEIVAELAPAVYISLGSEVAPRQGEYERTAASVINAYVGPASSRYLDGLADGLAGSGLTARLLVMQSDGGVVPPGVAKRGPLALIDSGPTGGLAGTATVSARLGHEDVITTDMGGTSFDVGLIVGGRPLLGEERVVGQYTYPLAHLDVRSIACGGGSIAYADPHTGTIRVGPRSAGSTPGPACYGTGGRQPTVTDADVTLGLVDAEGFLDGEMPLDRDAARAALGELGSSVGLSTEEAAVGVLRINDHAAATLMRQRTIEQGRDPRDFRLYAFGGAGPVHAFGFAAELGVREVVIPLGNGASTLSAYGIAASDLVRHAEEETSLVAPLRPEDLAEVVGRVEQRVRDALVEQGADPADAVLERIALMRYAEQQLQRVTVPIPDGALDDGAVAAIGERFDAEYRRLFGEGARAVFQAVELFTVRIRATVPLDLAEPVPVVSDAPPRPARERNVFWPARMTWTTTPVLDAHAARQAGTIDGPALVELPHTTVAIGPDQHARVAESDTITLHLEPRESA